MTAGTDTSAGLAALGIDGTKAWTAPMANVGSHTMPGSSAALGALAQHMMFMDLEDPDDEGQPHSPSQQRASGMLPMAGPARTLSSGSSQCASPDRLNRHPVVPTGFTPAEAYVDRQERTVFFAKCAPSASVEDVTRVFEVFGEVEEVNLFRQWPNAKSTRGCGLVVMVTPQGASAAIAALHRKFSWEGVSAPMVCERCCAARLGVKAATQHATRARRTAVAAAARRAARANMMWQGTLGMGGASLASCPLPGFPGLAHAATAADAAMLQHAPMHMASGSSAPLPMLVAGGNPALALAIQQQQQQCQQVAYGMPGSSPPDHGNSAPLPVMRSALSYGASSAAAAAAATSQPMRYSGSPPTNPGAPMMMGDHAALAALSGPLPPASSAAAATALSAPAVSAGEPALCPIPLQTLQEVALVADHSATLSALSGAGFWLQPNAGPAGGTGLALSGSPAQLKAAVDLISKLLTGGLAGAVAHSTVGQGASAACWA